MIEFGKEGRKEGRKEERKEWITFPFIEVIVFLIPSHASCSTETGMTRNAIRVISSAKNAISEQLRRGWKKYENHAP
jgi:hypothetical protein